MFRLSRYHILIKLSYFKHVKSLMSKFNFSLKFKKKKVARVIPNERDRVQTGREEAL